MYELHETVNKMLGKKSGLSYCDVRERYEHFRARCTEENPKIFKFKKNKTRKKRVVPNHCMENQCVIKIVPQDEKCGQCRLIKNV